jgi:hypothetical protein
MLPYIKNKNVYKDIMSNLDCTICNIPLMSIYTTQSGCDQL